MEVKKCPCCGSDVVLSNRNFFNELVSVNGRACFFIECVNPDCGIKLVSHYPSTDYDVIRAVAIDRFNRRTHE